jgi:hypothetical protein
MDDKERRKFDTFMRVDTFGESHSTDFAPTSLGKQLFTELKTNIAKLSGDASAETSGKGVARQGTSTRTSAREELRSGMEAIVRTARVMSAEVPGLEEKFRMPRSNGDQALLAAARAFVIDATPHEAQFIAHELTADFLQDLRDDIAALEAAIAGQASGRGEHVAARAEIDAAIVAGMAILRRLDAIIKNKYANNPGVLAEWTSASHVERTPHRSKGSEPPTQRGTGGGSGSSSSSGSGAPPTP